jgi:hypothetical protein
VLPSRELQAGSLCSPTNADLKLKRQLRSDKVMGDFFVRISKTVLHFALKVACEAITDGRVNSPRIVTPLHLFFFVGHRAK